MNEERIDRDVPREGDAYVIRLEAADGRRLLARISKDEADKADLSGVLPHLIEGRAALLVRYFNGQHFVEQPES